MSCKKACREAEQSMSASRVSKKRNATGQAVCWYKMRLRAGPVQAKANRRLLPRSRSRLHGLLDTSCIVGTTALVGWLRASVKHCECVVCRICWTESWSYAGNALATRFELI